MLLWGMLIPQNEDICGFGYCEISDRERSCRDKCEFGFYRMTRYHAERILHHYQRWRRGAKCKQPHPFIIGKAMDVAIVALRKDRKKRAAFHKTELYFVK